MIAININDTLLDVVKEMLETNDNDLVYIDEHGEKFRINSRHLLDLFIAGVNCDIKCPALLKLSPALIEGAKLEPPHQCLVDIIRYFISIFDSLHDGVLIADRNDIVRYLNKSFERITAAHFKKVVSRFSDEVRPGKLPGVIRSGVPIYGSRRLFEGIDYISDVHPIRNGNINMGGICVSRDITEIKQLQIKFSNCVESYRNLIKKNNGYKAFYTFDNIIGENKELQKVKSIAQKIALSQMPVLVRGESGTGKELFVHAIHLASNRAHQPFVTVNCAAIPNNLLESELFGYIEGAFSGAKKNGKQGLIQLADKGTLFLDEIGEMDIDLQSKLLRAINSGEIQPLGSETSITADVRVIAATNTDLEKAISQNKFRQDLFYRLNASQIFIPPLRERKDDIIKTAQFFLQKHFSGHPLAPLELDADVQQAFVSFRWPGNVRELENIIVFIGNITEDKIISANYLPPVLYEDKQSGWLRPAKYSYRESVQKRTELRDLKNNEEKKAILELLDKYGRRVKDKKRVAAELDISIATLYNKMNVLNIK